MEKEIKELLNEYNVQIEENEENEVHAYSYCRCDDDDCCRALCCLACCQAAS